MHIKNKAIRLLIFVILTISVVIIIYPVLGIVNMSFKSRVEYLTNPMSLVFDLRFENYSKAWDGANMSSNFLNSILYTGISGVLLAVLTMFLAFPIARRKIKFHKTLYSIFIASLMIPQSLIPLYSIMKTLKLSNTYHGMILFYVGNGLALSVFILTGFIHIIPKEMDEAAEIDGCGYFRYVFQIIFPLSKSALVTVIMLNSLNVWNDFVYPYLFIDKKEMRTLATGLFNFVGQFSSELNIMAAAVVIMVIPITAFYSFMQNKITQSLTQGAIKG